MGDETEALARALDRVNRFFDFRPADRIWWLYLREAVQGWLEGHEDAEIRLAYDRVKAFPENLPDERARWLDLRSAAQAVIWQK